MIELSKLIYLNFIKILSRKDLNFYKYFWKLPGWPEKNRKEEIRVSTYAAFHLPLKLEIGFNTRKPILYITKCGLLTDMLSEQGQFIIRILPAQTL